MVIRENPAGRKALSTLFKGVGAEIGVERGKFSEVIMKTADKLYLVDLWKNYPGYREHVTDEYYEEIYQDAQNRLSKFNVEFIRESSVVAALGLESNSLDFVYVDAAHDYQNVILDLLYWQHNVKSGGIMAGHDYVDKKGFGVIKAVNEYCRTYNIDELTIWRGDKTPSWSFIKP